MIDSQAAAVLELVDSIGYLLCGIDPDGRIVLANKHCAEFTEISRGELIGRAWCELFADAARQEHVSLLWKQLGPTHPSAAYEALCRRGRRVRWQFSHWPYNTAGVCAVGHDITDEHDGRARARSLDRLSALGNLCAGLAHEIRNPLNSASLQLALLERKLARTPGADALSEHVSDAIREIHRIAALLDDFIAFARPQPFQIRRVDLQVVVQAAVQRAGARAADAGVDVVVLSCPAVLVEIDPERVESALYNLIANAVDAIRDVSVPTVTVRWAARGNGVVVEVADNGPGPPAVDAPIFDPFFTTKHDGTGLGLAIVERVAIDHGGAVEVERSAHETVFRLRLPIVGGSSALSR